jgi:hypothetical protein
MVVQDDEMEVAVLLLKDGIKIAKVALLIHVVIGGHDQAEGELWVGGDPVSRLVILPLRGYYRAYLLGW